MRLGRITAALAAVAAVLALAAGCGGARTGATGADATISVYSTEPRSALTPGGAGDAGGFCVLSTLLAGLVVYDEQGKPVNEVASSITPNDDSTVFTVTLGHGWTFTDGTPVTARSFTRAWSYAANPANAQINASYFANIQGYGDLQRSTDGTEQLSGLVVTGDESFEIHLSAPDSILPQKLGTVPFLPLPDSFYDDPDAYASKPVGNGAYRFSSWTHGQDLTVTRNDGYHGAMPARNGGIDFRFYTSTDAAFMDVIAGNLDLLDEVPVDAARFFFNLREAGSQMDFDLGLAVEQSSSNPVYYVQYAHARICSVLKNAQESGIALPDTGKTDLSVLTGADERQLIKQVALLPEEIVQSAVSRDPSRLNKYAVALAQQFHHFYNACRIKDAEPAVRDARLTLCLAAKQTIENVLKLIGVDAPESM